MNRRILLFLLAVLPMLAGSKVFADDYQHISVNGIEVTKHVNVITFENDLLAMLHYSDQTVDTVLTEQLNIMLDVAEPNAIERVNILGGVSIQGNSLSVKGLVAGKPLAIYDMKGSLVERSTTSGKESNVDISSLPKGVYILKSGSTVVKFERR